MKIPTRLMVGLIDNQEFPGVEADDVHQPSITIKEKGGDLIKQYQGFAQVHGDIFLDVSQGARTLSELDADDNGRRPFRHLLDIERTLFASEPLDVDANLCRARLHFRDGELYTRDLFQINFGEFGMANARVAGKPITAAVSSGLDVTLPDDSTAALHFSNGVGDFVFEPGKSYEVSVVNQAKNQSGDHFQYYYGLLRKATTAKLVPKQFTNAAPENEEEPEASDPLCMILKFGNADYQLQTQHLDW
jgi:hypothetical protein